MSYLKGVKDSLEDLFIDTFEKAWKEIIEPALKQSYKNGLEEGRKAAAGDDEPKPAAAPAQRRRWSSRRGEAGENA